MKKNIKSIIVTLLAISLALCAFGSTAIAEVTPIDGSDHCHELEPMWRDNQEYFKKLISPDEEGRLLWYKISLILEYHGVAEPQKTHIVRTETNWEMRFMASDNKVYGLEVFPIQFPDDAWTDFYLSEATLYEFIESHPELCKE